MRISTGTLHATSYQAISRSQSEFYRLTTQFSSNKRINSAADDPVGAVQASALKSALAANSQYARNQTNAQNRLQSTESTLSDIVDVFSTMDETILQAGNATLSASDKRTLAQTLTSRLDQLMSLANAKDENGLYLFAGFNSTVTPFALTPTGANYMGDNGSQALQVSSSVSMSTNVPGSELFMNIRGGNGVIATAASAANAGTGIVDNGSVLDATGYNGSAFSITFANGGTGLEYSVVNTTTGVTVLANQPYSAGTAIQIPQVLAGTPTVSMTISGTPVAGDQFSLTPAPLTDVFQTIQSAITALNQNAAGTLSNTALADVMRQATNNLDQSLDQVLSVRGRMGNALAELDRQVDQNLRQDTTLQGQVSAIVDLDYAKAATELSQAQLAYQAAKAVYSKLGKQSLFDYL